MSHSIYKLIDPREPDAARYVGYTSSTMDWRLRAHIVEAKQGKRTHKCNWIRSLLAVNVRPVVELIEEVTEENWQEREKYWIKLHAATLTNGTAGGEGLVNPTQEVRDRISATLIAGGSGLGNQYRKGIPHTVESKKAISDGLKNSEAHRRNVEERKGVNAHWAMTEEQRLIKCNKIRQKKLGVKRAPFSEETKRNMSESHIGIKLPSSSLKKLGSRFINNGETLKQLKAGEPLPSGWVYGMKL